MRWRAELHRNACMIANFRFFMGLETIVSERRSERQPESAMQGVQASTTIADTPRSRPPVRSLSDRLFKAIHTASILESAPQPQSRFDPVLEQQVSALKAQLKAAVVREHELREAAEMRVLEMKGMPMLRKMADSQIRALKEAAAAEQAMRDAATTHEQAMGEVATAFEQELRFAAAAHETALTQANEAGMAREVAVRRRHEAELQVLRATLCVELAAHECAAETSIAAQRQAQHATSAAAARQNVELRAHVECLEAMLDLAHRARDEASGAKELAVNAAAEALHQRAEALLAINEANSARDEALKAKAVAEAVREAAERSRNATEAALRQLRHAHAKACSEAVEQAQQAAVLQSARELGRAHACMQRELDEARARMQQQLDELAIRATEELDRGMAAASRIAEQAKLQATDATATRGLPAAAPPAASTAATAATAATAEQPTSASRRGHMCTTLS